ncbi:unnamed protein product, partial [Pylaiella littoralis]
MRQWTSWCGLASAAKTSTRRSNERFTALCRMCVRNVKNAASQGDETRTMAGPTVAPAPGGANSESPMVAPTVAPMMAGDGDGDGGRHDNRTHHGPYDGP